MQNPLLKQCTKCKEIKLITEFNKKSASKDGFRSQCRSCDKQDKKRWDDENKQYTLDYARNYRDKHKQEIKAYGKAYYAKNSDKIKAYSLEYKRQNKNKVHSYYMHNNINYGLFKAINSAFKGTLDKSIYFDYLDYTIKDLMKHLESQFTPEMNWNNYGSYWEIDHIIPISTFCLKSLEDEKFKICWSLNNLRPLSKTENRSRPKDGSDISENIKNIILKREV